MIYLLLLIMKKVLMILKRQVNNKTIDEGLIDKLAFRVLAWKYYKGFNI